MPLPSKTKKVLNDISNLRDLDVNLGDLIDEMFDLLPEAVPEGGVNNATTAEALIKHNLSEVIQHGQRVTVNNPNVDGVDVYEFVSTAESTPISEGGIVVNIRSLTQVAEGSVTITEQPVAGDKVSVGFTGGSANQYTFVPKGTDTAPREIPIGDTLAETQASLVSAINGTDQFEVPDPYVRASDFETDISTITPLWGGAIGNDVVLQETFTSASNTVSSPTGGVDCTFSSGISSLISVVDAEDTQGVIIENDEGVISISATGRGAYGNEIMVGATRVGIGPGTPASNIKFVDEDLDSVATLYGGSDATTTRGPKIFLGEDTIYYTANKHEANEANWVEFVNPSASNGSGS